MALSAPENQKLFSIIVAAYNCGQKIENTLKSIFSNDESLFELIVMDGASTDDTLEHIKKYENRLTLISEPDEGVYYAFNKAIDLARGKYLYFIGAGDCLKPDILQQIKEFFPTDTPSLIYGKCRFVKQNIINGKEFKTTLFVRDNLCQQGIFYHRAVFDIVGKFDLRYKIFADWLFNLKCFMRGEISKRFIDLIIADYEEGGLSSEISRDKLFVKDFPLFIKKHFGLFRYFVCRAFLKNPYLFNYIYYLEIRLLFFYVINNYYLPKKIISIFKPFFRICKNLRKPLSK